jgi:hypothetical protein
MSDSHQAIYEAVRSRISGCDSRQAIESAMRSVFDLGNAIPRIFEDVIFAVADIRESSTRPSVLYRPAISIDGNQWCALYGANLQDGSPASATVSPTR